MARGARVTRNGKRRVPRSKRKATATKATPRRSAGRPVKASPAAAAIAAGVIASPKPIRFQPTFATRSASLTVRAGAEPKAHAMLADPSRDHLSITDIAYAAGFGDLSHFNHSFRRRYGATPREIRRTPRGS